MRPALSLPGHRRPVRRRRERGVVFHAVTGFDANAITQVQAQVRRRLLHVFVRRGLLPGADAQAMAQWQHAAGFAVEGSVRIEAADRAGRERLMRYCAQPPFALDRLRERDPEQLLYAVTALAPAVAPTPPAPPPELPATEPARRRAIRCACALLQARIYEVTLETGPHPDLSDTQQKVVALDYGMRGGKAKTRSGSPFSVTRSSGWPPIRLAHAHMPERPAPING